MLRLMVRPGNRRADARAAHSYQYASVRSTVGSCPITATLSARDWARGALGYQGSGQPVHGPDTVRSVASHREGVPHHFPSTHRVIPSIVREGRGLPIIGHGHRAQLGSGLHRAQPCGAMYSHEYTLGSIKVSASQSDRVRGGQDMQLRSVGGVS